jgi:hypothetical protein
MVKKIVNYITMCDQPSVHYALYLLVQIFAKYDNVPLDLYGLIEAEIRKLYYCEKKKECIEYLNNHIDDTMVSYEEEKRWFGGGRQEVPYTYIMPMRGSLNNEKWVGQLQRLENIIPDDIYYINGNKIFPWRGACENGALSQTYGFDNHSKQDYVSLMYHNPLGAEDGGFATNIGYYYHEGYYDLKKIIRRQMDLEECKIKKH